MKKIVFLLALSMFFTGFATARDYPTDSDDDYDAVEETYDDDDSDVSDSEEYSNSSARYVNGTGITPRSLQNDDDNVLPKLFGGTVEFLRVLDLPDNENTEISFAGGDAEIILGKSCKSYLDVGIKFSCFWILGIPFITRSEKYVIYATNPLNKDEVRYRELDREEIELFQEAFGDFPDEPQLPFWYSAGGKILVISLFLLILFLPNIIKFIKKKNQEV